MVQVARKMASNDFRDQSGMSSEDAKRQAPPSITNAAGYARRSSEFSTDELDGRIAAIVKAVEEFDVTAENQDHAA